MSQPKTKAELAEARERYEEEVVEIYKYKEYHTPIGECTSMCRREGCPLDEAPSFEDWLEYNYETHD